MIEKASNNLKLLDLLAWAKDVCDPNLRTKLVSNVQLAAKAQSCRADLVIAQHCCHAFDELSAKGAMLAFADRQTMASALLMQAALLYARATSTGGKGGERGSISVRDRLPDHLRA